MSAALAGSGLRSRRFAARSAEASTDDIRMLDRAGLDALDRLAADAAGSFSASMASITFADDHVIWLTGSFGFDVDRITRPGSPCGWIVANSAPLILRDAADDERFRLHALIHFGGVRSYAGVPLRRGAGQVVGTIAVFSSEPDAFGLDTLTGLDRLARLIEAFLAEAPRPTGAFQPVQGWLGVRTLASKRNRPGIVVLSVSRGSPADRAGLRPTDILHTIDGHTLTQSSDITAALAGRMAGEGVTIRFRRSGAWHECRAEIATNHRGRA